MSPILPLIPGICCAGAAVKLVNTAFKNALSDLLCRLIGTPDWDALNVLVRNWFSDPEANLEVSELLAEYHLDKSAIEAEAIRSVSSDLELLDRMLAASEARRNKALRGMADYRQTFPSSCSEAADRMLEQRPTCHVSSPQAGGLTDHGKRTADCG